jgi:hypothetical protein
MKQATGYVVALEQAFHVALYPYHRSHLGSEPIHTGGLALENTSNSR